MRDVVRYRIGFGPIGVLADALLVPAATCAGSSTTAPSAFTVLGAARLQT